MTKRNWDDPRDKEFRRQVRRRDKCCQWPGCGKKTGLQVHHILPRSTHPYLQYNIHSALTLCRQHHKKVTGQEESYAPMFMRILKMKENNGNNS